MDGAELFMSCNRGKMNKNLSSLPLTEGEVGHAGDHFEGNSLIGPFIAGKVTLVT